MLSQKSSSIIWACTAVLDFKAFLGHLNFCFLWGGKKVNYCKICLIFG